MKKLSMIGSTLASSASLLLLGLAIVTSYAQSARADADPSLSSSSGMTTSMAAAACGMPSTDDGSCPNVPPCPPNVSCVAGISINYPCRCQINNY